jgi:lipopolysaccharide/colanic/teichoic acid biosynthesis glycosyltransferase
VGRRGGIFVKHHSIDISDFNAADFKAAVDLIHNAETLPQATHRTNIYLAIGKPVFDLVIALLLLPILITCCIVLAVLNPFFNRGPLFYVQARMGRDCTAFNAIKFRTMTPTDKVLRSAGDPLEHERITRMGRFLRRTRIDELPQIFNVLRGDMSFIGPCPDYIHHARYYLKSVPGYRERHCLRPGVSGLAQIDLGYTECLEGTRKKVELDLFYIETVNFRRDLMLAWKTFLTVIRSQGY